MVDRSKILFDFLGLMIIIVFLARMIQVYSYWGYAWEIGLFSDKICYRGSYAIIVCLPDTIPPYETILAILAILLLFSLWLIERKWHAVNSGDGSSGARTHKTTRMTGMLQPDSDNGGNCRRLS